MKRSWIGLGLLLFLLAAAIFTTWAMDHMQEGVEQHLDQAAACALLGDWENARLFCQNARESWQKWELMRSWLADHTPLEEIDAGFAMLEVYSHAGEETAFAALCRELSQKAAAIGEAHAFSLKNIL